MQLFEAHTAELLEAGDYKLVVKSRAGDAEGPLQTALPFLFGAGTAATLLGCETMQTPSSKSQTSSVYAFGLPAVVITRDNKQVSDNSGDDENFAQSAK